MCMISDTYKPDKYFFNTIYDKEFILYQDNRFDFALLKSQCYVESGYNSQAIGFYGEIGLMQILPSTAIDMGFTPIEIQDVDKNIRCAVKYLNFIFTYLYNRLDFSPNLYMILVAYNYGIGRVRKLYEKYGAKYYLQLPKSVRVYAEKILAYRKILKI